MVPRVSGVPHFKREPAEKERSLACQVCMVRRAFASCASSLLCQFCQVCQLESKAPSETVTQ